MFFLLFFFITLHPGKIYPVKKKNLKISKTGELIIFYFLFQIRAPLLVNRKTFIYYNIVLKVLSMLKIISYRGRIVEKQIPWEFTSIQKVRSM